MNQRVMMSNVPKGVKVWEIKKLERKSKFQQKVGINKFWVLTKQQNKWSYTPTISKPTIIHKIFETNSSCHVK